MASPPVREQYEGEPERLIVVSDELRFGWEQTFKEYVRRAYSAFYNPTQSLN